MAIYFDLMALDQQERERRQRALQEAGRIGLQAYMQGRTQDREDAVANLQMGQAANNQALIRETINERYGGEAWADNSVARANEPVERPQLDQQMRQVAMEPVVVQQPMQSNAYMDAVRQEEQLPYWKNATPKQREAALGVLAERFAPVTAQQPIQNSMVRDRSREPIPAVNIRESMPIMNRPNALPVADVPTMRRPVDARTVSAEMPEMQQVKLDNPRQAAQRTGLPVKEIVTVRNSVRRSGIRGADSSEYVNNFEDTAAIVFDPKVPYQDKLTEIGRYLAKDKKIREFYGDQPASNEMLKILMGGLGGGGKGGAGGKMDYWSKGKRTIGLPRGMTPADFPETYSKFGGLGNEDWDLTSATPALTRQKEKADIMKKIAAVKDVEGDTSALEAQLDALNYGNPTKPKLIAPPPNWNNSVLYGGFGNQPQTTEPPRTTTEEPNVTVNMDYLWRKKR